MLREDSVNRLMNQNDPMSRLATKDSLVINRNEIEQDFQQDEEEDNKMIPLDNDDMFMIDHKASVKQGSVKEHKHDLKHLLGLPEYSKHREGKLAIQADDHSSRKRRQIWIGNRHLPHNYEATEDLRQPQQHHDDELQLYQQFQLRGLKSA